MKKEGSVVSSIEFPPDVYAIIQETMVEKEMSLGAAVRYLIKKGNEEVEWEKAVIAAARAARLQQAKAGGQEQPARSFEETFNVEDEFSHKEERLA